jgi:hypothetical protein
MKFNLCKFFILATVVFCSCSQTSSVIDLGGEWTVAIDSSDYTVMLPGSLSENGIGIPVKDTTTSRLSQSVQYEGPAVFEKVIDIPRSWQDRHVELYMGRTKVSKVFVNDSLAGSQYSISTPHVYLIQGLFKPGSNRLKIIVDNSRSLLPLGNSHVWSDDTQTNWNGILGEFRLTCLDNVHLQNIRIDAAVSGKGTAQLEILNHTSETLPRQKMNIVVQDSTGQTAFKKQIETALAPGKNTVTVDFEVKNPSLWDEYTPCLYRFHAAIQGGTSAKETKFGFRDYTTRSGQFVNNGRTVFLRGKHDGGVFPLTGYPSVKTEDWRRYLSIAKSYGINHIRFHSWTPPAAAFEAADELGVFLQPELPLWRNVSANDERFITYMKTEGQRIMEACGNHPSFVMFSLGNELSGDTATMGMFVDYFKSIDKRHLYANGSNNFFNNPHPHSGEDFFVSMRSGKMAPDNHTDVRGSFAFVDSDAKGGIINTRKPGTDRDYQQAIEGLTLPVVGHEVGQFQTFPDFNEIPEYTGVLHAWNLEVIKQWVEKAGLLSQAPDFVKASGALSALCYREEIELALRTPGFGGFQLLDLQDYPGQGTSLVGILNAFMESKGIVEREKWTEFCSDIVPLARFPKYCWTNDEKFTADIEVANYGEKDLAGEIVTCILTTQSGKLLYETTFLKPDVIRQGAVTPINPIKRIEIPLTIVDRNQKLTFTIKLDNKDVQNSWDIWVYVADERKPEQGNIEQVLVTQDKKAFEQAAGNQQKVLYIPQQADISNQSVGGLFITDFWNYTMFKGIAVRNGIEPSPGTLGILTNPDHPIFNTFPTDFHTNWQWWNIIKHSRPMILDDYPADYKPIVQVIDNFSRNHKLGLIYEAPGSDGKALVCSSDLFAIQDEPEVKALFNSLINYLKSK